VPFTSAQARELCARRQPIPLEERVLRKVQLPTGGDEALLTQCWLWQGACSRRERGADRPVIQAGGRGSRILIVARLFCEWQHGPPPTPGHEAGHTCPDGENALCVSPHHLTWMTRTENERHKWATQRRLRTGRYVTEDDLTNEAAAS
jgi:hypothetical protein